MGPGRHRPHLSRFDFRAVARPFSFGAFGLRGGANARSLSSYPERLREAPFGIRVPRRAVDPRRSRRVACRGCPAARPLRIRRPHPSPLKGSHRDLASPVALSKRPGRSLRLSRTPKAEAPQPLFGSRLRPKASPSPDLSKAEAVSSSPVSGRGWGRSLLPSPCRLVPRGDSRCLRRFGRAFQLRGAFRHCHGRFREIPPRIRLRLCGRGFVRLPAFRFRAPASLGERRRPSAWASRPWFGGSVSGSAALPAELKLQLCPIRKGESACGYEDNGGVNLVGAFGGSKSPCRGLEIGRSQASRVRRAVRSQNAQRIAEHVRLSACHNPPRSPPPASSGGRAGWTRRERAPRTVSLNAGRLELQASCPPADDLRHLTRDPLGILTCPAFLAFCRLGQ